ncbi:hypothetical protein N9X46_01345 [Paracoccaceae bacterium]|nr:hypothetical protein [Paracoccaceae bacterium]MDC0582021.1 hypothetical protein [Paracoccaceae bacterium]
MKNTPYRSKIRFRVLCVFCLLVAALLSSGQISARSVLIQDIAGHVVICSGDASVVLALDTHGAPISDETACPECSCLNPIDAEITRGLALKPPAAGHDAETLRQQDVYQKSVYSIRLRAPPSQVKTTSL